MTAAILLVLALIGVATAGDAGAQAGPKDGAAVYAATCARCHGTSGRSDTDEARALKVRPLIDDSALARMPLREIATAIRSNAKHRGFEAIGGLDEAELQAVASFVQSLARERCEDCP